MSATGGGGEGRLARWSQRKAKRQAGEAVPDEAPDEHPETLGRGGAAPVAGRRKAPVMLPLGDAEEGETGMDAAHPDALALLKRHQEGELEPEVPEKTPEEEMAALTPEQRAAVEDLPPVDSLDKNSDFTPFFADSVPEFLKRQAYRVLWRSNPFFAFRDGLNEYDEDYNLTKLINVGMDCEADFDGRGAKAAREKPEEEKADGNEAENKAENEAENEKRPETAAEDDGGDVGEAEDDDVDLTDADDDLGDGEDEDDIV